MNDREREARIRELEAEVGKLRSERAWLCDKCNTVFPPESLNGGFDLSCPNVCGGFVAPKQSVEIRRLKARVERYREALAANASIIEALLASHPDERPPEIAPEIVDRMHEARDRAHRALNDGEDDAIR